MIYDETDELIEKSFESLVNRCQIGLETSVIGSDFIFDYVNLLHCKCHKINFKHSGSYIDSPDWIKIKKATINLTNDDNKCFQTPFNSCIKS